MARIPEVRREDLPADQQHHFDYIAGNRPHVSGPFPLLLNSPDVASRIAHVGTYIRFENSLPPQVRELAILTVARAWDCQYEWTAHQPIAEQAGVRPEAIAAVRERTAPQGLTEQERIIFSYVDALIRTRRVPNDVFTQALEWLGRQGVTDLTATAGYYSLLACTLDAFAVMPPPETPPLLPDAAY
ncbi:MAG: carboxymuconolactone decarboxylase family protein [Dehalococcoidia bacterium]